MAPRKLIWLDRLRVERAVWSLDQQLDDLPRATRLSTRREVRENLLAAAHDIGTTAALRRIGSSRQLADGYLTAEFGSGPRHSWMAAAYFAGLVPLVLTAALTETQNAFRDRVVAENATATGTYTWDGISHLQRSVALTLEGGSTTSLTGGDWVSQPLVWILWIVGTIVVGRLWPCFPPGASDTPARSRRTDYRPADPSRRISRPRAATNAAMVVSWGLAVPRRAARTVDGARPARRARCG